MTTPYMTIHYITKRAAAKAGSSKSVQQQKRRQQKRQQKQQLLHAYTPHGGTALKIVNSSSMGKNVGWTALEGALSIPALVFFNKNNNNIP